MRGNRAGNLHRVVVQGSIPAYAGEPGLPRPEGTRAKVYPRVCGGTQDTRAPAVAFAGLSPRMRGNHNELRVQIHQGRSIPAYAGEPGLAIRRFHPQSVYPRVCGGT